MKIILFADKLPPEIGGMETHAHFFVQYFKKNYHLYIISHLKEKNVLVNHKYEFEQEINIHNFLKPFESEKCVVFFNSGFWIRDFAMIKSILKNAVFLYRTGGNEINKAPLNGVENHRERQQFWVNSINKNIDYLIANSQFTFNRLITLGVEKEQIKIISGGVDIDEIQKAILNKQSTRKKYGISKKDKLIVCCCRFVPYKRIDFLLQAFSFLSKKNKLMLVGDGTLMNEAKNKAKEMNLNLIFTGRLPHQETLSIIASANVYCQASTDLKVEVQGGSYIHTEGMGRSLLEAICSGVRVVVTDCGAISEFINENNGFLVNGDEKEFASKIQEAIETKPIDEEKRIVYYQKYDFNNIFQQYEQLWTKNFNSYG